jgi:hypothetical protein
MSTDGRGVTRGHTRSVGTALVLLLLLLMGLVLAANGLLP